jgi:hypothetical protein
MYFKLSSKLQAAERGLKWLRRPDLRNHEAGRLRLVLLFLIRYAHKNAGRSSLVRRLLTSLRCSRPSLTALEAKIPSSGILC